MNRSLDVLLNKKAISVIIIGIIFGISTPFVYAEEKISLGESVIRSSEESKIPTWVDQNFRWYGENRISQTDLLNAIKYLIEEKIMVIDHSETPASSTSHLPEWTDNDDSDPGVAQIAPSQPKVIIMAMMSEEQQYSNQKINSLLSKGGDAHDWTETISEIANHAKNSEFRISAGEASTVDSVIEELQGIVVLCSTSIDKELGITEVELELIEQISKNFEQIDDARKDITASSGEMVISEQNIEKQYWIQRLETMKIKTESMQTGISLLESNLIELENILENSDEDVQLTNIKMQNVVQKQQQTLQTMSNVSKMHHDTILFIINNMK